MQANVKYFVKHSLVYGISSIAQKASGVILIPVFTKFLTTTEFGQQGILIVTIAIISQILLLGQGQSIVRYNNIEEYQQKKKSVFFTLLAFITVISVLFIVAGIPFIKTFASLFEDSAAFREYLEISLYIIALTNINYLLANKLRADEKSTLFTVSGVAKLLAILIAGVYLVAFENWGVKGVLYSNLFGEILGFIIVVPYLFREIEFKFDKDVFKESLKFGAPLIFSGLAMNLLNWSDRYILKLLTAYSTLGLYELAYKVAGILNMFFIVPFSLTLLPIAYKFYKQDGDKLFYSKILTFFSFVMFWAGLALSIFAKELVHLFALNPSYYPAYSVVPLLTLSYCIFGISLVTSLGLYLTGKTNYVAIISIIVSAINIVLNFLLIPYLGMTAAALNTFIAFVILVILTTVVSNKYYQIPFEYFRLIKIVGSSILLYLVAVFFSNYGLTVNIIIKMFVLVIYPVILFAAGFFKKDELLQAKTMFEKIKTKF